MVVSVNAVDFIKSGPIGHIDLTADDWLNPRGDSRIIESHTAVHYAVVCDGNRSLPLLFQVFKHPVDAAGAVQKTVFRMNMKMCELSFLLYWHSTP